MGDLGIKPPKSDQPTTLWVKQLRDGAGAVDSRTDHPSDHNDRFNFLKLQCWFTVLISCTNNRVNKARLFWGGYDG